MKIKGTLFDEYRKQVQRSGSASEVADCWFNRRKHYGPNWSLWYTLVYGDRTSEHFRLRITKVVDLMESKETLTTRLRSIWMYNQAEELSWWYEPEHNDAIDSEEEICYGCLLAETMKFRDNFSVRIARAI
jgi:hypothetical protein